MIAIERGVPELLTPLTRENLLANIQSELVHALDAEWHDGNVNHPLAAYCTLICGGELCKEEWVFEAGLKKLKRFQQVVGNRRHPVPAADGDVGVQQPHLYSPGSLVPRVYRRVYREL